MREKSYMIKHGLMEIFYYIYHFYYKEVVKQMKHIYIDIISI